jgi:hypothetical protein
MALRLKRKDRLPPNGFPYIDQFTGKPFPGMMTWQGQVKDILQHRKDNNTPRASLVEIEEDLEQYTLNLHPELGYEGSGLISQTARSVNSCASCGGAAA